MLKLEEFDKYRAGVESQETMKILDSGNPDGISRLQAKLATIYARINNCLAEVKDQQMVLSFGLIQTVKDDKGKAIAHNTASVRAECEINQKHEVTRRQMEYLLKGLEQIGYACSARIKSFEKEGHY